MKDKSLKSQSSALCPCGTGKPYALCCEPFHQGQLPDSALKLMRSRYSAYALGLSGYIMATTHPLHPKFVHDSIQWSKEIALFCSTTQFHGLDIINHREKDTKGTVTFKAHLTQNKKDVSFTEKSRFEKMDGKWFYRSGIPIA